MGMWVLTVGVCGLVWHRQQRRKLPERCHSLLAMVGRANEELHVGADGRGGDALTTD